MSQKTESKFSSPMSRTDLSERENDKRIKTSSAFDISPDRPTSNKEKEEFQLAKDLGIDYDSEKAEYQGFVQSVDFFLLIE